MNSRQIGLYILAGIVIGAVAAFLVLLVFREAPAGNKDALMMALGALLAAFGTVIGYFFGSSQGSADKTHLLKEKPETPTP